MKWTERQLRQDNTKDFLEALVNVMRERAERIEEEQRLALNRKN